MPKYSGNDHYIDPESGVLKNRLGITGQALLEAAEADFVAERSHELSQTPLAGRFDLAHLQAIHRNCSATCTSGRGSYAILTSAKALIVAHHAHIASAAAPIFRKLAAENHLAGLGPADFSDRAAYYLAELIALHPFREGNGRAQREFISHLARASSYYIAWENVNRAEMLQASIGSFRGDTSKLVAIIRDNLHPD